MCQHTVSPLQGRLWRVHHVPREWDRPLSGWNELSVDTRVEEDRKRGRDRIPWPPLQDLLKPCLDAGCRVSGLQGLATSISQPS